MLIHSCAGSAAARRDKLWQFLLDLLLTPNHGTIIQWTGRENEFKIVDTPTVARLWSAHCQSHRVEEGSACLDEFQSALESCCSHGLLQRVGGRVSTFKFLINIQRYIIEHKSIC